MKKSWERPKLEVLDVSQTKKGFGPPWDWDWKGRGGGNKGDPDDLLGS